MNGKPVENRVGHVVEFDSASVQLDTVPVSHIVQKVYEISQLSGQEVRATTAEGIKEGMLV